MAIFNASEIFQFAIRIEENGVVFYREMAKKHENEKFTGLFNALAEEEIKHKEVFEKMVSEIEDYQPHESYPGEYFAYVRAYADSIIFNKEKLSDEIAKINTPVNAIDFAIAREWESISYYQEIKGIVPEGQHVEIDKIIAQEREHFTRLSEAKKQFFS